MTTTPPQRNLPAVDKVLAQVADIDLPRPAMVAVIRRVLEALRAADEIPDTEEIDAQIRTALRQLQHQRIVPVINATGVLIHTNLGRAPLGRHVIDELAEVASQYGNLEFDLSTGGRGGRSAYLEHNLALLCGAEAATVVNNNAGALVLVLRHLCQADRSEVIISRGELVQIGGGFRIPDILEASGATLREVGTTNSTSIQDYRQAISPQTALLLKVHRSNFFMGGFVESPSTAALATLAKERQVPLVEDLGSGAVVPTELLHSKIEHEPTPEEVLRHGVDLVTFSGDKLLGGPQAGILAGKQTLVEGLRREPFFRALRCDKLILVALQTVVDASLRGEKPSLETVPIHAMLTTTMDQLRQRAETIKNELADLPWPVAVLDGEARIGGGSLPRSTVPSVVVSVQPKKSNLAKLSAQLRLSTPPVIGYIQADRLCFDLRTVFPQQDRQLIEALKMQIADCGLQN